MTDDFERFVGRSIAALGDAAPQQSILASNIAEEAIAQAKRRTRRVAVMLSVSAVVAAIAAWGLWARTGEPVGPAVSFGGDVREFAARLAAVGGYDYDLAPDPKTLATWADLVVLGKIVSANDGHANLLGAGRNHQTVQYTIEVDEVVAGDSSGEEDGRILMELPRASYLPLDTYTSQLPQGQVLLFLYNVTPKGDQQTIYWPSPQGFWIQDGTVAISTEESGSDALPGWEGLDSIADIVESVRS